MVEVGKQAPKFSLKDAQGKVHSLSDYKGKKIILYFYPKDNTPGCTREACDFRDSHKSFAKKNVVIIGISPDSPESHQRFIEKFDLPFVLLSDPEKEVLQKYGVWDKKSLYGRIFTGVIRSTFIIDEKGKIVKQFRNVRVNGHIDKLLELI